MSATNATAIGSAVAWHDAECGAYSADLALWERLAAERGGPVLDLGAGTGRVALRLAERGHEVVAGDRDGELLAALERAAADGPGAIRTVRADVRELDPSARFPLVLAPMQLLHLLDAPGRRAALAAIAGALRPGGLFAAALLDDTAPLVSGTPDPLPDVREVAGWTHSSLPLALEVDRSGIAIRRLRQLVSPAGELSESEHLVRLSHLSAAALEAEARELGLIARDRVPLAETDDHVGSIVVQLERGRR